MKLDRAQVEDVFPLSHDQAAVLFRHLTTNGKDGPVQVLIKVYSGRGFEGIQASWESLVRRHASLRTSVHWESLNEPVQVVHRAAELPWSQVDLSRETPTNRDRLIEEYARIDADSGFDLRTPPLLRLAFFRFSDRDGMLLLTGHHIVFDGWSVSLLLRQASDILADSGRYSGEKPSAPALYKSYVAWQRSRDESEDVAFWKNRLTGILEPDSRPSVAETDRRPTTSHSSSLTPSEAKLAGQWIREQGITIGALVTGLWARVVAKQYGVTTAVVGMTVTGRPGEIPGIDAVPGLFSRAIPLVLPLHASESSPDYLKRVHREMMTAGLHQHISPGALSRCLEGTASGRIFDSLVVIQSLESQLGAGHGQNRVEYTHVRGDIMSSYPLTFVCIPAEGLTFQLRSDGRSVSEKTLSTMSDEFMRSLRRVLAGRPLQALDRTHQEDKRTRATLAPPTKVATKDAIPTGPMEQAVCHLMARALGLERVSAVQNFFELGGTSLQAARLADLVHKTFDKTFPLVALLEAATPRELASWLAADGDASMWKSLVAIKSGGSRVPIFCVHAGGGNVLTYQALAGHLAPEQPFYGLQAVGLDGSTPPLETVESMATHYITEVRSVAPKGPYYIAGHCFGARVALEMARQLESEGEEIGMLCILDARPPTRLEEERDAVEQSKKGALHVPLRMLHHVKTGRFIGVATDFCRRRLAAASDKSELFFQQVKAANARADHRYRASNFSGTLLLISAADDNHQVYEEGWSAVCRKIVHRTVDCIHDDLLTEPYAAQVANHISKFISDDQPDDAPSGPGKHHQQYAPPQT